MVLGSKKVVVYRSHMYDKVLDFKETADNIHAFKIHNIAARTLSRYNQNIYVIKVLSTQTMKVCIHFGGGIILF